MLHVLHGTIVGKHENAFVIECGGIGLKAYANPRTLSALPPEGSPARVFCRLFVRETEMELYAFMKEEELSFFEVLNSVAGVGPKTALGLLSLDSVPNLTAAVLEKRADMLTRAPGIGKKTAERIILELESKVKLPASHAASKEMDMNHEVEEILVGLGYQRYRVREALQNIKGKETIEERLRHALRELGHTH